MRRDQRKKHRPSATGSSSKPGQAGDLAGLSKRKLVELVLELQAKEAAAPGPKTASSEVALASDIDPASDSMRRPQRASLIIEASVRSGQMIEFPHGDVTVIGSVGSGAEIIAGGSIHVYGTLRGRAIAGASGDQSARIFCQDFQPELLCIDGGYRAAENLDPGLRGRPIQAYLDGMRMVFTQLA